MRMQRARLSRESGSTSEAPSPRHLVQGISSILAADLKARPRFKYSMGPWRAVTPDRVLGRLGDLEVRLAASAAEMRRAQALRYRVFYEEMSAVGGTATLRRKRDADRFDAICDHLVVVDRSGPGRLPLRLRPEIVGTCRLLRQDIAARRYGFYGQAEFDVEPLLRRKPDLRFLELGRSCILKPYRTRRAIELLWHGIWRYALRHQIDVMIGCASLEGTDPDRLALSLSFLHHYSACPAEWSVRAQDGQRVEMNRMPPASIDPRQALHALPPLLKGYLRLGARIGDGAVIDRQFGTVDVFIVLPVAAINPRYINYYGTDAQRRAA
jgi:L-ornithine Nalpha-acyltransferase